VKQNMGLHRKDGLLAVPRVGVIGSKKLSSLLQHKNNHGCKSFINTGSRKILKDFLIIRFFFSFQLENLIFDKKNSLKIEHF
jgi:hypothetical protein